MAPHTAAAAVETTAAWLDGAATPAQHAALSAGSSGIVSSAFELRGRSLLLRHVAQRSTLLQPAHPATASAGARVHARARDLAHRHGLHFRRAATDGQHTSTPPPHSQG